MAITGANLYTPRRVASQPHQDLTCVFSYLFSCFCRRQLQEISSPFYRGIELISHFCQLPIVLDQHNTHSYKTTTHRLRSATASPTLLILFGLTLSNLSILLTCYSPMDWELFCFARLVGYQLIYDNNRKHHLSCQYI